MLLRFLEFMLIEMVSSPHDNLFRLKKKVKREGMDSEKYEEIMQKCGQKNILVELLRLFKNGDRECYKEKLCKFILDHTGYSEEACNLRCQNPCINNEIYIIVMIVMNCNCRLSRAVKDVLEKIECKKPNQALLLKLLNNKHELNAITIEILLDLNNLSLKLVDRLDRVAKGCGNPIKELFSFLKYDAREFVENVFEELSEIYEDNCRNLSDSDDHCERCEHCHNHCEDNEPEKNHCKDERKERKEEREDGTEQKEPERKEKKEEREDAEKKEKKEEHNYQVEEKKEKKEKKHKHRHHEDRESDFTRECKDEKVSCEEGWKIWKEAKEAREAETGENTLTKIIEKYAA